METGFRLDLPANLLNPTLGRSWPSCLIPDFVPLLGYLDDVAVVLGTFALADAIDTKVRG